MKEFCITPIFPDSLSTISLDGVNIVETTKRGEFHYTFEKADVLRKKASKVENAVNNRLRTGKRLDHVSYTYQNGKKLKPSW